MRSKHTLQVDNVKSSPRGFKPGFTVEAVIKVLRIFEAQIETREDHRDRPGGTLNLLIHFPQGRKMSLTLRIIHGIDNKQYVWDADINNGQFYTARLYKNMGAYAFVRKMYAHYC